MRRSGIYVLMNGTWHRKSSYIDARLAGEVGRPGAAIIAIFDAATGDYRVVEESGVEEAVSVEASVRHAGLRWRVSSLMSVPTRISTVDDLEAGYINHDVAPTDSGVWIDLDYDGPEGERYGAVEGATTESAWSNWPGLVKLTVPLAAVDGYRETVTPDASFPRRGGGLPRRG